MASVNEPPSRANIRIEIKNDFTEEMEVDTSYIIDQDIEDGEISDSKSVEDTTTKKTSTNHSLSCGVESDIPQDQEKLQVRAQRFGLESSITESDLQELYKSLGVTADEEINTRFEAIHMYGTSELNTQDVFDYFGKYSPASIEWINDESCNVVWLDKMNAVKAFLGLSRAIEGMPSDGTCEKEDGRSILLKQRTVLSDIKQMNTVKMSDVNIPIPAGYWRLGEPHLKSKYLLLRYAKITDKKPLKSEKFSEYCRKYGNPNLGGIRGLISESKKKRMKGLLPEEKVSRENPWGSLAKNWNNDTLERDPTIDVPFQPKTVSKSILNRLGANKRTKSPEIEPEPKKSKVPRMRMYADEEEARIEKVKQLKKIRELEKIEENMAKTIPDLRNRIGRHTIEKKIPEPAKLRPVRIEVTKRNDDVTSDEEEDVHVQQKSKVTVIVKKPPKPTVASTIWSRLDLEKKQQTKSDTESKSDSSKSSSESSDSETDEEYNMADRQKFSKAVNSRPGFNRDLKSRLGLNTDHKSPLRIEINNDHYKKH